METSHAVTFHGSRPPREPQVFPSNHLLHQERPAGAPGPDTQALGAHSANQPCDDQNVFPAADWDPLEPLVRPGVDSSQTTPITLVEISSASQVAGVYPQEDWDPRENPRRGPYHKHPKKAVPKGRILLSQWGLNHGNIRVLSDIVQARHRASLPRPVGQLFDLIAQDLLRLAFCHVKEDSASADSIRAREAMWDDPEPLLETLLDDLQSKTYRPSPICRQEIPKGDGTFRPLGLPALRDKVVQMALLILLDPILDPQFVDNSVGFRLKRRPQDAIHRVRRALESFNTSWVLDLDLKDYFGTIPWIRLMEMVKIYVSDPDILRLIQLILMAPVRLANGKLEHPTKGTPQGGVLSPLLANLYLHHTLDTWLISTVRKQIHGCLEFARFADDIIIIVTNAEDAQLVHQLVVKRVESHELSCNAQKTKLVNMTRPSKTSEPQDHQSFPFLGFQFNWVPDEDRGWRLANVISESSIKKSIMRVQQWLEHHSLEPMTEEFCEYPARALGRRMAGFYGYYLHPNPNDAWAIQKHNTQVLENILNTWAPQGLCTEDETDIRYVMDPAHRFMVFDRYRYRPEAQKSQPRRADAFEYFLSP